MTSDQIPALRPNEPPVVALDADQFARLRDLLADYSGVYLDATRHRLLESVVAARLEALGDDLMTYERRLQSADAREELRRLAELVLNHETMFFRNLPHMQALRDVLIPELHRRKPRGAPIRIWSAGCATGEEPYSLAMVALEALGMALPRPVEIWATDLSAPALEKAREGLYRARSVQNVLPELLERYFKPAEDGYRVGAAARALVRFEQLNLLDPFPPYATGVDIIFCQNVTIYFQLDTCRRLIERFYACLPAGGLLCLGFSETLWNIFDRFHTREVAGAYVYYKEAFDSATPLTKTNKHIISEQPNAAQEQPDRRRPAVRRRRTSENRAAPVTLGPSEVFNTHAGFGCRPAGDSLPAQEQALLAEGQEILGQAPSPAALLFAARAHADRGELELAQAEAQRAIDVDQLNDDAYMLLGVIYGRQGQWTAAILQFERARYLHTESPLISFHLAEAYRQAGFADKAAREYRGALRKLERHPPGALLDGVAVGWLREACERQIAYLPRRR